MSAGERANQQELARFLRSRRERANPAEVGLPVGSRRRTKGLRREEVAVLAGLSTSWYTYLEQGRHVRPAAAVLDSLGRVLRMSEDERRYLHVLAHGQVSRPEPLKTAGGGRLLTRALQLVQDSPYPAYAGDHRGDLLAWNHAATQWYDDWGRYPVAERNIVRWMLLSPLAKARLTDWEPDVRDSVARWRAEAARWPTDPRTRELIAELSHLSPEFTRWWADHDVQEHRSRIRRFQHPELGPQTLQILPVFSPEFPASAIILHLPIDADPAASTDQHPKDKH
jgi:transcriptional regulator with XRE-family HTH domain